MNHALLASCLLVAGCASARAGDRPAAAGEPVLVELFTSQGCSSCPPADKLLGELGGYPRLIPLSFHVNYWNDLGWKDPFSSEEWSRRQGEYARVLGRRGVYTPQVVVGGATETVGSNRVHVLGLVTAAASSPLRIQVTTTIEAETLRVRAVANPAPAAGTVIMVAIAESGLATQVPHGENAGRRLVNDHVVRRLLELPADGTLTLPLDRAWNASRLEVVAFAQDRKSLRVLGAARAR